MIDRLTQGNSASSELRLPRQAHQENPRASVFGDIFLHNAQQYSTLEAATALANFLGGKVVNVSEEWGGGAKSPEYNIELGGKRLNAGLLADRFTKYGTQTALKMTQDEVGGSLAIDYFSPPSNTTAAPEQTQPAPAAATSPARSGSSNPGPAAPENAELRSAAVQFEALVLTQLIRAAKESGNGNWLNTDEGDASAGPVMEMAEEYLSQALSSSGSLGLSELITKALQNEPRSAPVKR